MTSSRRARTFRESHQLQIAMPMGGIGTGSVSLNGYGGLQDWALYHRPATTATPDQHYATQGAFACLHLKGERAVTRLIEGPLPIEKVYDQGLQAQGYRKGGSEGLPRFRECTFHAAYPFGYVELHDPAIPVAVELCGFNPFIPLDDRHSGIPCAILEYEFTNKSTRALELEFSFHMSHPAYSRTGRKNTRNHVLPGMGVLFNNTDLPTGEKFGSATLTVIGHTPVVKAMWYRGGWFDWISTLWREVSDGQFQPNQGNADRAIDGHNGGSVMVPLNLAAGATIRVPVLLTWYFPNVHQRAGVAGIFHGFPSAAPVDDAKTPDWRPFYAGQWSDAADVAQYIHANYNSLRDRTHRFRGALERATLPDEVLDAVSSNLAILKSPTVLRQENGNLWAWEGCFTEAGCCPGSCTHVWNYAQALPHLFPKLERTLREQELERSMDARGHVNFRAALPDGPVAHDFHPAADGQLGGILKVFRDWQISGDRAWLEKLYPAAKRSLDFCIETWDPARRGALFEPHHNTYDIEFWGPDGMCSTVYMGALMAFSQMAEALGRTDDARSYASLAVAGAEWIDANLFNGDYYFQKVMWEELRDQSFVKMLAAGEGDNPDYFRLSKSEGPRYQYGRGCLSDGVIGAWMAKIYGVDLPLKYENVRSHLRSVHQHNFKQDLSEHACTQRPGYATGIEPGLLLCTWPKGDKPTLPFVYSDEVWTGIEYQVASHLIEEQMLDEGLAIVRGVRQRYDGRARNPFNEYECGSFYARALSSYAVMNSLSGLRYSAATRTLWLSPKMETEPFTAFLSTETGWGTVTKSGSAVKITLEEGTIQIDHLCLSGNGSPKSLAVRALIAAGAPVSLRTD